MSDVESNLLDTDSIKESKSDDYSRMLNLVNESVTNTKRPDKKSKSKSKPTKHNKNKSENTKVKKQRQHSPVVAPSEELVQVNNNDDDIDIANSGNWTGDETGDEMLDFDSGTVEFNVKISRFVALAAAMLVCECERKQPKWAINLEAEKQLSRTEQLLNDSKRSLPKSCSQEPSKEALKISSKDTNLNPVKDEKTKTFSYRRKQSSKEILKQDASSNTTSYENDKSRNPLLRSNPSSKEVLKKISKQDATSTILKIDKSKRSKPKPRSKPPSKEVSKVSSKLDITSGSNVTKEEKPKIPFSKTTKSSKEELKVSSSHDQNQNSIVKKDDKPKKFTSRSKQPRKKMSKNGSKQDIDSSTLNKSTSTVKQSSKEDLNGISNQDVINSNVVTEEKHPKKSKLRNSKQASPSRDVLKISSNQDQDINSNISKDEQSIKSSSKCIKQSSKENLKVDSNQDQDINSNQVNEEQPQPKKKKSKKPRSNTKSIAIQVREDTAEVLDFDVKQYEPEQKPPRPVKKKRTKKATPPKKESKSEPVLEPDPQQAEAITAANKGELETFLVEATGQSENVVTNFSIKRKSKKSRKNKNQKPVPEERAPSVLLLSEPDPEPDPDIKDVARKKSAEEVSTPATPTTVALLPPTASEVSISTTGSNHAVTYPPVPTIGANMGDQTEVLKYLVQIQNYINHLGYHHHNLGEPKIHINSRHSMKQQMAAAREIMQTGEPIKSLHAAVLAVHFTNCLDAVERFPIYFRSHVSAKEYKHIVLGIFVQGNYGALGISRDSGLQDKPASYAKLSDLIFEFAKCYGHSGHVLNEVHFGAIMTHDPTSSDRLFTKNHVIPVSGCLHSEVEKAIEKIAKLLRNKMGRACMKIKPKRSRDLKSLSTISSNFNKSSRTGLMDYVGGGDNEKGSCASIRLRVLNMNMSVNLLDNGAIKLTKTPAKTLTKK